MQAVEITLIIPEAAQINFHQFTGGGISFYGFHKVDEIAVTDLMFQLCLPYGSDHKPKVNTKNQN